MAAYGKEADAGHTRSGMDKEAEAARGGQKFYLHRREILK